MGDGNVMFSVDYPFENSELAAQFIENAKVAEDERIKVASGNAKRILHLNRPAA
jgi:2,3-dihydroxybenzoate decarboxylase